MDIVKRAYLKTKEEMGGDFCHILLKEFHKRVEEEIKRLIQARVYSGRDWPRELGTIPDELRSKRLRDEQ